MKKWLSLLSGNSDEKRKKKDSNFNADAELRILLQWQIMAQQHFQDIVDQMHEQLKIQQLQQKQKRQQQLPQQQSQQSQQSQQQLQDLQELEFKQLHQKQRQAVQSLREQTRIFIVPSFYNAGIQYSIKVLCVCVCVFLPV